MDGNDRCLLLFFSSMFNYNQRYCSFLGYSYSAFFIQNLALLQLACMQRQTARLQWAQSKEQFSLRHFSQLQMAFSYIPMDRQASARFLQSKSFSLHLIHFYKMTIDSEQRPKVFKATDLLLFIEIKSYSSMLLEYFYSILLHISRQSFGRFS